jgi:hypothetical protein
MRPKLKAGDSILVSKNKVKSMEHWGVFLKYESGAIHYRSAQSKDIYYCTFKDIIQAVSSVGEKLK